MPGMPFVTKAVTLCQNKGVVLRTELAGQCRDPHVKEVISTVQETPAEMGGNSARVVGAQLQRGIVWHDTA